MAEWPGQEASDFVSTELTIPTCTQGRCRGLKTRSYSSLSFSMVDIAAFYHLSMSSL